MGTNFYVCGIFYAEAKGEESKYPNLRGRSSAINFQEIYWKNLIVMYASARKNNPEAKLVLFTNIDPPTQIIRETLNKIEVSVVILNYKSKPQKNNWESWQSTFYIIDAFESIKEKMEKNDTVIFLDLDCIVVKSLKPMLKVLEKDKLLKYELDYSESHMLHGINRLGIMNMIEYATGTKLDSVPKYFGGELYGVSGKNNAECLYKNLKEAWELAQKSEQITFHTEEHLFNYIFGKLGNQNGNANGYIKRLWTAYNYRNIEEKDIDLAIWHLPSEKKHGMLDIYKEVINENSEFWTLSNPQWAFYIGHKVTIPKRNLSRIITDITKNTIKKLLSVLQK